jgi:hypothetical protein
MVSKLSLFGSVSVLADELWVWGDAGGGTEAVYI